MLNRKLFPTVGSVFVVLLLSGCMTYGQESGEDLKFSSTESEVSYGGHDYLFVNTPKTWQEAQTYCALYNNANGGSGYHLVTIESAGEEAFLNANEAARGFNNWWIGYSDIAIEGTWTWVNGVTATFVNWSSLQPDNWNGQHCAIDRYNGTDFWDDTYCFYNFPFICERDANASGVDGAFPYSATNTNSAQALPNTVRMSVQLFKDQVFTAGTCGLPGAAGTNNTYLRLKAPNGTDVPVAYNDNSGDSCGTRSNFSIVVPANGTYWIWAGCAGSTSCSGTVAYNY